MSTLAARGRGTVQPHVPQIIQRLNGALTFLLDCFEVSRQRRQLLELDDHMLKDIGITRAEANLEGNRHIWDLPDRYLTSRSGRGVRSKRFGDFAGGQNHSGLQRCGA